MKVIKVTVVSVHTGASDQLAKEEQQSIIVELDGIVGDRHRSFTRESWGAGDKQPAGTVRRNERQWSAISLQELAEIKETMDLTEAPTATTLGANLCLDGIDEGPFEDPFSLLVVELVEGDAPLGAVFAHGRAPCRGPRRAAGPRR